MQKVLYVVILWLTFASVFAALGTGEDINEAVYNLFDQINNNILVKVSNVIGSVRNLPASQVDSSPMLYNFSNGFVNVGVKYLGNRANFKDQFLLYTPTQPKKSYDLKLSEASVRNSSFNGKLDTKFLIHGYSVHMHNSSVFYDIKDSLLKQDKYNVIVVNWTNHNQGLYSNVSVNAAFVGFEVGKLIQLLMQTKKITVQSIHLIGHSMGAQVCGFASKVVDKMHRISGIDAAGPLFQMLPKSLRLSEEDAEFVDALHSNGASTLGQGYGVLEPFGDIDFFPNGGSHQPKCSYGDTFLDTENTPTLIDTPDDAISCHHDRGPSLYLFSIDKCHFKATLCTSYEDFKAGNCTGGETRRMGYYATPYASTPPYTKFYLDTTGVSPYCKV